MIRDPKNNYGSYYRLVNAEVRKVAAEQYHIDRSVADDVLFPGYGDHIVYGALSNDDGGLTSYGPVAVFLKAEVTPLRVSLLIENSFQFLKKHYEFRKALPAGYRAVWDDRGILAVVKLGGSLTPATAEAGICELLLQPGSGKDDDDFIEVHIYDGFDKRAVERVVLQRPPMHPHDRNRWLELTELLTAEGISFGVVGAKP